MSIAKEICEGVPRSLLDSPVSDIHLSDIASKITEWHELAPYLDLSEVEEKDIVDSYPNRPKLQRREALRKWKESNHSRATYRRLIAILCSQGRVEPATALKELIIRQDSSKADDSRSLHQFQRPVYSIDFHNSVYHRREIANHQHVFLCEQGTRFFLKLNIIAHPMPTTVNLYRNGVLLHRSPCGVIVLGINYIELNRVQQSDDGNYTISTSNSMGEGRLNFQLRVISIQGYQQATDDDSKIKLSVVTDIEYCILVFYNDSNPSRVKIDIAITKNAEINITEIKGIFSQKGATHLLQQVTRLQQDTLTLDIPMEGVMANDWRLASLVPYMIYKRMIDSYISGNLIPCFHLLATLNQRRESFPDLDYTINLIGATRPHIHITIVVAQAHADDPAAEVVHPPEDMCIAEIAEVDHPPEDMCIAEIDEISKRLFQEAMLKEGHVLLRSVVLLLVGVAGAGKTCFSYLLFDESPPVIRESTPLAQSSVRAISFSRATVSGQDEEIVLKRVSSKELNLLIADVIKALRDTSTESSHADLTSPKSVTQQSFNLESMISTGQEDNMKLLETSDDNSSPDSNESIEKLFEMEPVQELLALISNSKGSREISRQTWLYLIDSGGQPQFHDLLPTFVRHVSAVAFFVKLNEALKDYPTITYYSKGGIPYGDPYLSSSNHLQILQNCLQAMQSRSASDTTHHCPDIFFIGTHRDLESTLKSEPLKSKNEVFQRLLLQHNEYRHHFYSHSSGNLLYPVNSKAPNEADKKVVADFRKAVMNTVVREDKVPIRWFVLEQLLQTLSHDGVISFQECMLVASHLGMKKIHLQAALNYLVKLNIFEYFPNILSDVVFTSSQVLLNKITELVEYSHYLRNSSPVNCHSIDMHFRDYGMLHLAMLQRDDFSQHYVPGLFEAEHLLNLLVELSVVAKDANDRYTMPAVLPELSIEKVEEVRVYYPTKSTMLVPVAIHYPGCLFPSGIFCSLFSILRNEYNWNISKCNGMPQCLFKNCIKLEAISSELFADITLVYKHYWIEVYAEIRYFDDIELLQGQVCMIRDILLNSLLNAAKVQKYQDLVPKLAFFCPCEQEGIVQQVGDVLQLKQSCQSIHIASVFIALGKPFMCCTRNIKSQLNDGHHLWLRNLEGQYLYPQSDKKCSPQLHVSRPVGENVEGESSESSESSKMEVESPPIKNTEACQQPLNERETPSSQCTAAHKLDNIPTLRELALLKYTVGGEKNKVRIIEEASHNWKKIASLISDFNKINALQEKYRGTPEDCLRQTLVDDFINNKPKDYSHNWSGLIELLDDADLTALADRVKCALLQNRV